MKILRFICFTAIIFTTIFISDAALLRLSENRDYPIDDVSLSADTAESVPDAKRSPFELRYDLTDENLDVYSLNFKDVYSLSSVDEWEDYMRFCISQNYKFVFFKAPADMGFDLDTLMSQNEITSVIIYTLPESFGGKAVTGYEFTYTFSHDIMTAVNEGKTDSLDAKKKAALDAANAFLSTISDLSDYEKELAIHNYVCERLTYTKDESQDDIINCYGGLVLGRGNCQAYTDAFTLLCRLSGFDCGRITCTADGNDHSMNYIKIEGLYYFVDCTFDDGIADPDRGYGLFYFNAPLSTITIDHTLNPLNITPQTDLDYNSYYLHYDIYADTPEELTQIYRRIADSGTPEGEILYNTANGSAALTEIFTAYPASYRKISTSKFSFGSYEVLKFKLS